MTSTPVDTQNDIRRSARRRRGAGCSIGCLTLLVLALLVVGAGFVFGIRPYAQSQLDQALTQAVGQIPPDIVLLPPGTIPINANSINNQIVLNLSPSNPVKDPHTTITPDGVRVEFQVFGNQCAISTLPSLVNGQIKATNVRVEGIAAWIISPDELTMMLNKHFAEAQTRLKHSITAVQVKNNEVDVILGRTLTGNV